MRVVRYTLLGGILAILSKISTPSPYTLTTNSMVRHINTPGAISPYLTEIPYTTTNFFLTYFPILGRHMHML